MIKIVVMGCGRISEKHCELLGKGHIKGAHDLSAYAILIF